MKTYVSLTTKGLYTKSNILFDFLLKWNTIRSQPRLIKVVFITIQVNFW